MLIAGTQSGCGKTTVTLALMQYLRAQNLSIAPFKAGPDFLDPMWHAVACNQTSYNLDTRMIGEDACMQLFDEKRMTADISIIEGVMGLFDGVSGVGREGSSAHLARTLNEPVLLVINAKGMSGSIVPMVEGFVSRARAMDVNVAGIIANHTGSENHARILRELLLEFDLPPLMAWIGKGAPQLPERHLGLQMPGEVNLPDFSECLHVEKTFTPEAWGSEEKQNYSIPPASEDALRSKRGSPARLRGKTIAIARDAAFCFIYPVNLEWLQAEGADVQVFSPLAGETVPDGADAVWLPGGYPELHVKALSESGSWDSLRSFIEADKPVLAECGGMMVLGENILTAEAQRRGEKPDKMAGVLPCQFVMQDRLAGLGYREDASGLRGHEFHHSKREFTTEAQRCRESQGAFEVTRGDSGMRYKNLRASYIHWYFASQPKEVVSWFL